MSRFFWSSSSERSEEALLARRLRELLTVRIVFNSIKLKHQQHYFLNQVGVNDNDDESIDSASLSSSSDDDSDESVVSGDGHVGLASLGGLHRPTLPGEGAIDAYLDANIQATVYRWVEARNKIHQPFETAGVEWGKSRMCADIPESEGVLHFRFRKEHLTELVDKLWVRMEPFLIGTREKVICTRRYTIPYETGMLLLIFRLAHMTRVHPEMEVYFGLRRCHIGAVLDTFSDAFCSLSMTYLSNPLLLSARFPLYAASVHQKCGLLDCIWGFIDGTVRRTCRPTYFQQRTYSGHKRHHGLKFQSVVTPDGLYGHFFGPTNGNRHDSFMLGESGLLPPLAQHMAGLEAPFSLYGDPAYPQSALLFGGFRNPPDGSDRALFNTAMSKVRESVEWGFAQIVTTWPFLNSKLSMKIFETPVARYYILAAFLSNLRNCIYHNQIAKFFDCRPLNLDEYLALADHDVDDVE